MPFRLAALLYCAAVLTPFAANAQQRTTGPIPTDFTAAVPAVNYESAFTGYVPFRDEKLAPWREVNDEAARIGGHVGIVGGAAGHAGHSVTQPAVQAPAATPKLPVKASPPMMHGAGHEGKHK